MFILLSGRDLFAEFRRITRNGALLLRDQLDEVAVVAMGISQEIAISVRIFPVLFW